MTLSAAPYLLLAAGLVHHRGHRGDGSPQCVGDVHVRRAHAERRQPDLCHVCSQAR